MPSASVDQSTAIAPLISGNLHRNVLWLALPALGEQLLNYTVVLWDMWLAGQVKAGADPGLSSSAVGTAAYTSWLASLLFVLIGTGTTALVSLAWGAGDFARGNRIANCSISLAAVLGIVVAAVLYAIAPGYVSLLNLQGESSRIVVNFLRVDSLGQTLYVFCIVGCAALRGAGDMRSPLVLLGLVNVLNIVLSTTLVFGHFGVPAMGLNGIVTGTVISRCIGGLVVLAALARGVSGLKLHWGLLRPTWLDTKLIARIGLPQVVDGILMWIGHSIFLMIISRLGAAGAGEAYKAAHMIAIQVEALTYLPATAWGNAAATLVGQNLGAGKFQRAMGAGHAAALQCSAIAIAAAFVYLFGSQWIYQVMTQESLVREIGTPAMRYLSLYQLPLVVMIIYIFSMRGAGDTRTPMAINMLGILAVRLPIGYLGGIVLNGGLIGAWSGMFADVAFRCLLASWLYRRGGWARVSGVR